jgi:hypothetical protein
MNLDGVLIVGFIVVGLYKFSELLIRRKERLMFIEKFFTHCEEKKVTGSFHLPDISFGKQSSDLWPLRVSLLLIGTGVGCMLATLMTYGLHMGWHTMPYRIEELIYFACIATFGGAGLLAAYLMESKKDKTK